MVNLRLNELRKEKNLTQSDVSKRLRIARETYSRYESGQREMTYASLVELADLFDVSVDYLLGRYDNNPVFLDDTELSMVDKFRSFDDRAKKSFEAMFEYEYTQSKNDS